MAFSVFAAGIGRCHPYFPPLAQWQDQGQWADARKAHLTSISDRCREETSDLVQFTVLSFPGPSFHLHELEQELRGIEVRLVEHLPKKRTGLDSQLARLRSWRLLGLSGKLQTIELLIAKLDEMQLELSDRQAALEKEMELLRRDLCAKRTSPLRVVKPLMVVSRQG